MKTQEKQCIELGGVVGSGMAPTLTELGFSKEKVNVLSRIFVERKFKAKRQRREIRN